MSAIAAALVLLLTAEAPATAIGNTEVLQAQADRGRRMTVPVRIGNNGPFRFLVDTGSERTVVSTDLASQLPLVPDGTARIVSIAGLHTAATASVDEIALGRRTLHDLSVLLFESEHIGADGIIGLDSLQDQRVQIDFRTNTMHVGDAQEQGGRAGYEIVVTARRRDGQLIMTNATIDGVSCAVIIDTGAESSVGNPALENALRQRSTHEETLVSVTGQEMVVRMAAARRLSIGRIGIVNPVIAFAASPAFRALKLERRPALMLGMRELRMFKRVAIDFATRKVLFDLPTGI